MKNLTRRRPAPSSRLTEDVSRDKEARRRRRPRLPLGPVADTMSVAPVLRGAGAGLPRRAGLRACGRMRWLRCASTVAAAPPSRDRVAYALEQLGPLFQPTSPWTQRVQTAAHALHTNEKGELRRIAIVGAPHGFVDTILADPVDERVSNLLAAYPRHAHTRIQHGQGGWTAGGEWTLPLSWLHGIELFECAPEAVEDADTLTQLLACDAVYLVVRASDLAHQDTRAASSVMALARRLATKPHTRLLVDCDVDAAYGQHAAAQWAKSAELVRTHIDSHLLERLARHSSSDEVRGAHLVSHTLAQHAQAVLCEQGLPEYARILRASRFAALYMQFQSAVKDPHARAEHVALAAFHAATDAECVEGERLATGAGWARVLEADVAHDMADVQRRLVPTSDADTDKSPAVSQRRGDRSTKPHGAQADARHLVQDTLQTQFPWWRLLWRIDELRLALSYAVGRSFGTRDEILLTYEAGRLRGAASEQYARALQTLDEIRASDRRHALESDRGACADQPSLDSATLRNALASYDERYMGALLHAHCLSEPLLERRAQLLSPSGTIHTLVTRAQRAVATTFGALGLSYATFAVGMLAHGSSNTLLSTAHVPTVPRPTSTMSEALATVSWLPDLTPVLSWTSMLAMTPTTAGASALLATMACAYYLQGRWTRAKRAFWRDWDRTVEMAEREQKTCIDTVLRTQVYGAPLQVAHALREQIEARQPQHQARLQILREVRSHLADE